MSPRRQARSSRQPKELNRITLVDELKAIECGDDDYRLKKVHDTIDDDAFKPARGDVLKFWDCLQRRLPIVQSIQ